MTTSKFLGGADTRISWAKVRDLISLERTPNNIKSGRLSPRTVAWFIEDNFDELKVEYIPPPLVTETRGLGATTGVAIYHLGVEVFRHMEPYQEAARRHQVALYLTKVMIKWALAYKKHRDALAWAVNQQDHPMRSIAVELVETREAA